MKLLIVDDHPAFREGLRVMLGQALPQLQVWTAGTTEQALSMLADAEFDAVLADIRLPGRDGLWLCSEVKDRFPCVAMLLMSAEPLRGECPPATRFVSKWASVDEWAALLEGHD